MASTQIVRCLASARSAGAPVAPVAASRAGVPRRAVMWSRSELVSQRLCSGSRNHTSHGTSQTSPITPITQNMTCQPCWLSSHAASSDPTAGPAYAPALKIAVARPRSPSGAHSRVIRPHAG